MNADSSNVASRSNKSTFGRHPQHTLREQPAEDVFARRLIDRPQSLCLRQGDAQAGHLGVLSLHLVHQCSDRCASWVDGYWLVRYRHDVLLSISEPVPTAVRQANGPAAVAS